MSAFPSCTTPSVKRTSCGPRVLFSLHAWLHCHLDAPAVEDPDLLKAYSEGVRLETEEFIIKQFYQNVPYFCQKRDARGRILSFIVKHRGTHATKPHKNISSKISSTIRVKPGRQFSRISPFFTVTSEAS